MSERRVYVLGAGASKFAGYPLATELMQFLQGSAVGQVYAGRDKASSVLTKLQRAGEALRRQTRRTWDLETVVTQLDLFKTIGNLRVVHGEWTDKDRMVFAALISGAFLWHQHQLQRAIWEPNPGPVNLQVEPDAVRSLAQAWAEEVEPGDTIVSLNWDLLHEAILWRAGKWSPMDGYGFDDRGADPRDPPSKVMVYKLHGSVDWVQADETDDAPELESMGIFWRAKRVPKSFPPTAAQYDHGRKLITPTYLKDISKNSLLLRVWDRASCALEAARDVYVIGYSLPTADHPARHLFAMSLLRNRALRQITLVTPPENALNPLKKLDEMTVFHWQEFLKPIREGLNLDWFKGTFEDWLRRGSVSPRSKAG